MTEIQTIDIKTIQTRLNITNGNDNFVHQQFTIDNAPKFEMCRMEVYFITLLHKGEILIETELTSQAVQAPALLAMAPPVIRKFITASSSYSSEAIFFDNRFFLNIWQMLTIWINTISFIQTRNTRSPFLNVLIKRFPSISIL